MRYQYQSDHHSLRGLLYMIEMDSTMPNRKSRRRGIIQSVDRAARILEALAGGPRRLGGSELAGRLRPSRPTRPWLLQTPPAHRLLGQGRGPGKNPPRARPPPRGEPYPPLKQ